MPDDPTSIIVATVLLLGVARLPLCTAVASRRPKPHADASVWQRVHHTLPGLPYSVALTALVLWWRSTERRAALPSRSDVASTGLWGLYCLLAIAAIVGLSRALAAAGHRIAERIGMADDVLWQGLKPYANDRSVSLRSDEPEPSAAALSASSRRGTDAGCGDH